MGKHFDCRDRFGIDYSGLYQIINPVLSPILDAAAGGSDDWVKGVGGVELAYTLELPGGGLYGFDLPASEIVPASQEIFLATRVFGEYIATKFGSSN